MKEILPYFGHDNNALTHPKCQALLASHGFAGYGRFWALNERIASSEHARLDLSKKVNRAGLAVALQLTLTDLEAFLVFLADDEECGLINYEDGIVTTDRTTENLKQLLDSREAAKARKEAKKASSPNSAQSSANYGESSANFDTKESKVKIKETKEASSGFDAEFSSSAQSEKSDRERLGESEDDEELDPGHDPVSALVVPSSLKFTRKNLAALFLVVGKQAQAHLDLYAAKKAKYRYAYRDDWSGMQDWWAKDGSPEAWLAGGGAGRPESEGQRPEMYRPVVPFVKPHDIATPDEIETALRFKHG